MSPEDTLDHEAEALRFLQALETNSNLAHECELTDLPGRLSISKREAYYFSESDLRVVVRNWDYHGTWLKWLHDGRLDTTLDDLPELTDHYSLSDEKVASFREDGHVLLPSVLSQAEVDAYRPVFRSCAASYNPENRPVSDGEFQSFVLLVNLRTRDERIARLALGHRFSQIAAEGTLHFASGSHKEGDLGFQPISEEAESYFAQFIDERGYQYTPGADALLVDPQNLYQERAMNFGFNARPGDPARSPIHPIV